MPTNKEKALMTALSISLEEAQQMLGTVDGSNEVAAFKEAELFLTTLEHPDYAVTVKCKNCGEEFQSSYRFNKHCSKECLKASLAQRGIDWDSDKSDVDRWRGMPPSVIAPETLKILRAWAEQLLNIPPLIKLNVPEDIDPIVFKQDRLVVLPPQSEVTAAIVRPPETAAELRYQAASVPITQEAMNNYIDTGDIDLSFLDNI